MPITRENVEATQRAWGDAVVHVGAAPNWQEAYERAKKLVSGHYCLAGDTLLFCPTMASEEQFRKTFDDAVSYFVGNNENHPEDRGFALEPWVSVRFENAGVVSHTGVAFAMGNYFFGRADGTEVKVEYSFVFVRDLNDNIKIQLHHSALPYGGATDNS